MSKRLRTLLAIGKRKLLLNLGSLSQVDSSGVGVIIETYIALKRNGGELKLLNPSGRVRDVLTVFRLIGIIPAFEDEARALASFRPQAYSAAS